MFRIRSAFTKGTSSQKRRYFPFFRNGKDPEPEPRQPIYKPVKGPTKLELYTGPYYEILSQITAEGGQVARVGKILEAELNDSGYDGLWSDVTAEAVFYLPGGGIYIVRGEFNPFLQHPRYTPTLQVEDLHVLSESEKSALEGIISEDENLELKERRVLSLPPDTPNILDIGASEFKSHKLTRFLLGDYAARLGEKYKSANLYGLRIFFQHSGDRPTPEDPAILRVFEKRIDTDVRDIGKIVELEGRGHIVDNGINKIYAEKAA